MHSTPHQPAVNVASEGGLARPVEETAIPAQPEIGVSLPEVLPPGTALPDVPGLARVAEQAGLDGVWAADRLVNGDLSTLDPAVTLAAAAAVTSRVDIGFAVLVPSLRPLAWAAKQVATLAHLAGPRLRLGVAAGAGPDTEYQLAGFDRAERGRRTGDFLRLLPSLLGGQPTPVPELPGQPVAQLRPAVPVPPVWVGGQGPAALRRAVRYGDGWLSGLPTPEEFADTRARLFDLADQAGRPRPRTGVGLHAALGPRPGPELKQRTVAALRTAYGLPAERAGQVAVAGTPAEVAGQLARYVAAGADLIVVVCDPEPAPDAWELLAQARQLLRGDA
jgi:alkanesulfonate monooxygenase SsuD/methylene tetrahydromethanopterin reductase-like flavin-dependent oxidoreductase (luciferase family)